MVFKKKTNTSSFSTSDFSVLATVDSIDVSSIDGNITTAGTTVAYPGIATFTATSATNIAAEFTSLSIGAGQTLTLTDIEPTTIQAGTSAVTFNVNHGVTELGFSNTSTATITFSATEAGITATSSAAFVLSGEDSVNFYNGKGAFPYETEAQTRSRFIDEGII